MAFNLKNTFLVLITASVIDAASFFTFQRPIFGGILLLTAALATFIFSLRSPTVGLAIVIFELLVGSQGHLFVLPISGFNFSIRMALFTALLVGWATRMLVQKKLPRINLSFAPLFILLGVGLAQGIINNDSNVVFFDVNGWLFFLLLPVFLSVPWQSLHRILVVPFVAATGYLALKTIVLLPLFSFGIISIGDPFYRWIRVTGTGEITYISGTLFRIFTQSQIFLTLGVAIAGAIILLNWKQWSAKLRFLSLGYLLLITTALLISQSRSFWVGGLTALLFTTGVLIWQKRLTITGALTGGGVLVLIVIAGSLLLQLASGSLGGNPIANRFSGFDREPAGMSRISQLQPLGEAIFQHLLVGYGFGKTLTYVSSDPRIVATHPGGIYTTYAFEWGYLDIMLKIGLLGLLAYAWIIFKQAKELWQRAESAVAWGLFSALLAITVTNIFSPYLNHPLGIGFILLVAVAVQKTGFNARATQLKTTP
ncbi:MAG: hypothetical protein A2840_02325 [Candidatus Buchananbacteria bacterium RIFCSPHIGHO2_01_FULL_47_11b]|uniref:Uncharacterized protein n=1 Tax=Candidatus Buchananbacteria bacterium RIFCSPHIGHO2_01_FULL_47_11b TaxID=1797537 RepID=A0A1G1Y7M8_9BACT|nr:MAG: hypothetical protein A2840_02325 [Candidatus Buchananbacteria bacterium RIFCSPHIGHO2_01_FULL_47_11b]